MNAIKFLIKNLDKYRFKFFVIFIIGIFDGVVGFLVPVALSEFTKTSLAIVNFSKVVAIIILLYASSLILQWFVRRYGEALAMQFSIYLKVKFFKKLEALPVNQHINIHSGYVLSLINKVTDEFQALVFSAFWVFAHSISHLLLFFIFTARESLLVAFYNTIILSVFVVVSIFLSKKMIPIAKELNIKRAGLLETYVDFMTNMLTIKKLNIYSFAENKIDKKVEDNYIQIQKLQNFHANRWFILHVLFGLTFVSTICYFLYQISQGSLSPSILILFVVVYAMIKGNVERLSEIFKRLMEMNAYIKSLDEILKDNKLSGNKKIADWQAIKIANVKFSHKETEKEIVIPDFKINKYEKVCIIGKSGEGKTTFLNILANFLHPQEGKCLIDDIDYNNINQDFFIKNVVVISQEVELFNISLRENIVLGQNISDEKIFDIFKEVDLYDWAKMLPKGLDTIVGEKGVKLSAGQKQRINLIRGIVLDREIYLLDEPISHLDKNTGEKVTEFLKKNLSNKTAIIVTHHEDLKMICNKIYVTQNGKLTKSL
ncbi:ABC transporter ATP-binding protein [Candidatus Parcubacteria bacterium]|nr:ABC transporter ATP-binding protein [Candidatus Parcubacteria bacterium]